MTTLSPIVEAVLDEHASALGADASGYRNHVYRVLNLGLAAGGSESDAEDKIAIASVFHDLGIWTDRTFDYLGPSVALADRYLETTGRPAWREETRAMIAHHHQVTRYRGPFHLAETFRRADWADVTWGVRACGLPRSLVRALYRRWPDAGFHRRLVTLTLSRTRTHPLSPLPMFKW